MKRFLALASTMLFLLTVCFGQPGPEQKVRWTSFVPTKEPFAAEVPVPLDIHASDDDSQRFYSGKINGTYFFVFSEKVGKKVTSRAALQFAHSYQAEARAETFGVVKADRFEFKDDEGYFHVVLYFVSNQRDYLMHCLSRVEKDSLITRFYRSLRIFDQKQTNSTDASEEPEASATDPQPSGPVQMVAPGNSTDPGLGSGSGSGSSRGAGSGSGAGTGNGNGGGVGAGSTPSPTVPSSPLKILAKGPAGYTDMARIYNIQGVVRMRVTFTANGSIGSVVPISFLPFGLTKNAIKAAKAMRFQPRTVNGIPVSVAKIVEYSFSIY